MLTSSLHAAVWSCLNLYRIWACCQDCYKCRCGCSFVVRRHHFLVVILSLTTLSFPKWSISLDRRTVDDRCPFQGWISVSLLISLPWLVVDLCINCHLLQKVSLMRFKIYPYKDKSFRVSWPLVGRSIEHHSWKQVWKEERMIWGSGAQCTWISFRLLECLF